MALAMAKDEEEIMEALRNREQQLSDAWARMEAEMNDEVEESLRSINERIQWVAKGENELVGEESRLNALQEELEERMRKIDIVMKGSFCISLIIVSSSDPTKAEKTRTLWTKLKNIKSFDTGDASSRTSYGIATNPEANF